MKRRLWMAPVAGLLLVLAGSAQALTISGVTVVKNGPNTANSKTDTLLDYHEFNSTVAVADTGGTIADLLGNSVDAKTRYAATTDADGGAGTAPSQSATSDYKITFTVSASAANLYNVTINTSRLGALTRVDDGTGGGTANIGAVTGRLNSVVNGTLGMAAVNLTQGTGAANTPFSQTTSTLTLTGLTGTNTINLDFSWTSLANSTCTGFLCSTTGNDEMAVRLGVADSSTGATAGDYPGVGSRTQGNDGHLVTITAIMTTPESGTALLMALGLSGLGISGRRKTA